MKHLAFMVCALFVACAPLRSDPLPEIGPPEYAHVVAKRDLNVRSGETRVERGAWTVMSLNPVIVAGAVLGVEDEFGRSQLSEYELALVQGGAATVQSRYIVQEGQCVVMRRAMHGGTAVIIAQDETRCAPQANATLAQ